MEPDQWIKRLHRQFYPINPLPGRHLKISCGEGGPAFLEALDWTTNLENRDDSIVYMVEDDYLHCVNAGKALKEGVSQGFDYVTLYDHPDKYLNAGPNPYVRHGAEKTRVYLGDYCHWKLTNSTTMTFACKLGRLREDADVFRRMTINRPVPPDFAIWTILWQTRSRTIASSIPAYATHCESKWLAPLVDWEERAKKPV